MQQQIIEHYGYEHQLTKLIEELRELEEVILYHTNDEYHMKEEMADVLNLIEQIAEYKGWTYDISSIKDYKIKRQIMRMNGMDV